MLRSIGLVIFLFLITPQRGNAGITAASSASFVDPSCIAPVSTTASTTVSTDTVRLAMPTFLDLKIEIQRNLTAFFASRLSAVNITNSENCADPFEDNCTIVDMPIASSTKTYPPVTTVDPVTNVITVTVTEKTTTTDPTTNKTTITVKTTITNTQTNIAEIKMQETVVDAKVIDNSAINAAGIYDYVVFQALYKYFTKETLDSGQLETVRTKLAAGYSKFDARPFSTIMQQQITESGLLDSFLNKSSNDVVTLIDSASTEIAEQMMVDGLFAQQSSGYSSLVAFPITSRLMECLDGTFRNLFMRDISATTHRTPFGVAQDYFKPAVMLALILYFIAYGYRIVMAHGMGKQSEIIMFGIKFVLVFYFSVGEAWKDFAFDMLKSIPATVAQIMFSTMLDVGDGCAAFKPSMYPQGKGMLSFFDMIDCKYANYIGLPAGKSLPGIALAMTFPMIVPVPFVGTIISLLSMTYFALVTFGILASVEVYVSAILLLTFYLFLAPIAVPMALFAKTEGICKQYQTKVIGTTVQALMAVVLLVITFGLMDVILYGTNPQDSGHDMFIKPSQPYVNGIPQVSVLNSKCYDSWANNHAGGTLDGGVVPITCTLTRLSSSSWSWWGFPIPTLLEVFSLPNPFMFLSIFLGFYAPCVMAIVSLMALQFLLSKINMLVSTISGMESVVSFGKAPGIQDAGKVIAIAKGFQSEGKAAWAVAKNLVGKK